MDVLSLVIRATCDGVMHLGLDRALGPASLVCLDEVSGGKLATAATFITSICVSALLV
jgi:hypothetical protein